MAESRTSIDQLIEQAWELHRRERAITLESVLIVGRLDRGDVATKLGISIETLAKQVGLTSSMYFKRAQAARVVHHYPRAAAMIEKGETEVSHIAAVAGKISPANADILLAGIKHKSRREVEQLLSVVTIDGRILDREPEVEIRVTLTKSQLARLDRAREVLSHGGKVPSNVEVLLKAVEDLLERRDPVVKAERAGRRGTKRAAVAADPKDGERADEAADPKARTCAVEAAAPEAASLGNKPSTAPGNGPSCAPGHTSRSPARARTAIPAAIYHAVIRRDGDRCSELLADGSRCPERMNLEVDHIVPVCQGGLHAIDNCCVRCRRHNRRRAARDIGEKYLVSWAASRDRASARPPEKHLTETSSSFRDRAR